MAEKLHEISVAAVMRADEEVALGMPVKQKISRFNVVGADVDQLRAHYANTIKPVRITPMSGNRTISIEDTHFSAGEFDLWAGRCRSGMDVIFSDPPDVYALYIPLAGVMEIDIGAREITSSPETLIACDLTRVRGLRIHSERSHIGIAFSKSALARTLSEMIDAPVLQDIELHSVIDMNAGAGKLLAGMADFLRRELIEAPEPVLKAASAELFLKTMMTVLLENIPHQYSRLLGRPNSPALPRHVRKAIDFMAAHPSEPLDLDQIARAAGVSKRALQLGFQQFRDTTPLGYFRHLRLEKARSELKAAGQERCSVSEVARRYGFSNVGRFSAIYRETFGESPSLSLQRSAGSMRR